LKWRRLTASRKANNDIIYKNVSPPKVFIDREKPYDIGFLSIKVAKSGKIRYIDIERNISHAKKCFFMTLFLNPKVENNSQQNAVIPQPIKLSIDGKNIISAIIAKMRRILPMGFT
jgi:hypothetical protein